MPKHPSLIRALRFLCVAASALMVLFASRGAHAAGTLTVVNSSPQETDGRWKLQFSMNMGQLADTAHVPMIFRFTPTVLYERSLEDKTGDKPVLNRRPLVNQSAVTESMDVGFSDSRGKIFPTTKFDFMLRRDRGYEAGEYELVVIRSSDGAQIGQKQRIKLLGDNPVIDRRAMVFVADKKEKKPATNEADASDTPAPSEPAATPADEPSKPLTEPTDEAIAPPPVSPKQGGCGCRMVDGEGNATAGLVASLGFLALVARRRRVNRAGA
jgi:MYXO-CTERM domain-containing protein